MTLAQATTPPMGWNSWDCFGTTVTEPEVLANATFLTKHLREFGWDTVVVDIDWSDPAARAHGYNDDATLAMDAHGRLVPDPGRFPSAAHGAGFGPLADRVHRLGLKFGIHVMRGIPRRAVAVDAPIFGTDVRAPEVADPSNACAWHPHLIGLDHTRPGAQEYYDSLLELYARWGVDFIKADDMLWAYQDAEIAAFARAVERCGREIQLSLSPGRDLSTARWEHLRRHATMWRICDDVWDCWDDVAANFARFARWAPLAGRPGWPDGDMLPLGRIGIRAERGEPRHDRLTPAERTALMTLWVIARSPLMIGGDLPSTEPATLALFTHPDVLAANQHSSNNREVFREDPLVLWAADGPAGVRYAAAFNLGPEPLTVWVDAQNLGFPADVTEVTELWTGRGVEAVVVRGQADAPVGVAPGSTALLLRLDAHGAALMRQTP